MPYNLLSLLKLWGDPRSEHTLHPPSLLELVRIALVLKIQLPPPTSVRPVASCSHSDQFLGHQALPLLILQVFPTLGGTDELRSFLDSQGRALFPKEILNSSMT